MAVLGRKEIEKQIKELFILKNFDPKMIGPASYDLRLGEIAIIDGVKITKEDGKIIELPPNKLSYISTKEKFNLPENICSRVGISFSRSKRGLLPLFGPQIDPGFNDTFWGLVYNMSDEMIKLEIGKKIFKMEFNEVKGNENQFNLHRSNPLDDPYSWGLTQVNFFNKIEKDVTVNVNKIRTNEREIEKLYAKINSVESGYQTVTLFGIFLIATTILSISAASILTILFSQQMPIINGFYSTAVILGFLMVLTYIFREVFKLMREIKEPRR